MKDSNSEAKSDVISGRNPVSEAIRSGRPIDKILVARGEKSGAVVGILAKARDRQIPVKEVDRAKLDYITGSSVHQGIAAFAAVKDYSSVDEIFEYAESRGESPFIVVLDEIEDPHNLGAIIRTAECAGVHGVIIPKRRSAGLSYVVGKASAGAVEYMRVARVTNIASLLDELKDRGVWIYGADMNGEDYTKRRGLHKMRFIRRMRHCYRQRGQGDFPACPPKMRRDCVASDEGQNQLAERLSSRRNFDVPRGKGKVKHRKGCEKLV